MKRYILSIGCLLVSFFSLHAQQETLRIKSGEDAAKAFSPNGFYRFPAFTDARFTMKDGQVAVGKANYNYALAGVQYINQKGDTLVIASPESVSSIIIGTTTFLYDKYYMEVISNYDSLKLAKRVQVKLRTEKKGGYGESAPSASIDNYQNIFTSSNVYSLKLNQDVVITKTTNFFLLDYQNRSLPATKKNIDKLVTATGKPKVEEYIQQNNTDFTKEESLTQLVEFAAAFARPGK